MPVYFVHSVVSGGVRQTPRVLHRHRGGPNFKNAPALTPGLLVHYNTIYIYIRVTLTARSTDGLAPKPSGDDPSEKYRPARYMIDGRISRFPIKFRFARYPSTREDSHAKLSRPAVT